MEALGEDHPEVDVMPGRMSRQEDHTFYPPIQPQPDVLNHSSETLKETPRVHKERIQKPADPRYGFRRVVEYEEAWFQR